VLVRKWELEMSGPIFAIPSLEGLREAREIATPASTPRRAGSDRRDALGTILYLGCIALVGALTVCTLFGTAFYLVAHPTDKVISPTGMRYRLGGTPVSRRFPALAPAIRAGGSVLPQPGYPGAKGQSAELAKLASIASAFIAEPEPLPARASPSPERKRLVTASAQIISGSVTEVTDAMTWVVGGQIVHLWGIRPWSRTAPSSLTGLEAQVNAEGPISCRRQAHSTRYRCLSANREDIAEMALFSGIGRAAIGAPVAYRDAEARTRAKAAGRRASHDFAR
jgi:hypothetical protein